MNTQAYVSWNLRGANNVISRFLVRNLVASSKPALLCLQETKSLAWTDKSVKTLGMGSSIGWAELPSQGLSGGLLTVWNSEVFTVFETVKSSNWLMIKGQCEVNGKHFTCINVYSPQGTQRKKKLWDELTPIIQGGDLLTLVLGDFNAVRKQCEKHNCTFEKIESQFFNKFIKSSGLFEVQLTNSDFTWYGREHKKSKLDRFLVTSDWVLNGNWIAEALHRQNSDHRPLVLKCDLSNWGPRPFKFFNSWMEDENMVTLLKNSWAKGKGMSLKGKFKGLKMMVKEWSKTRYGCLDEQIKLLEYIQEKEDENKGLNLSDNSCSEKLAHLYKVKCGILCQKARFNWQLKGERNTGFFHRALAIRRSSNSIHCAISNGKLFSSPVEIKKIFKQHFENLLTTKNENRIFDLHHGLLPKLNHSEIKFLVKDFTLPEIEEALFRTCNNKAPGLDGFNAGVLKSLWPDMKEEVLAFFRLFSSFW